MPNLAFLLEFTDLVYKLKVQGNRWSSQGGSLASSGDRHLGTAHGG